MVLAGFAGLLMLLGLAGCASDGDAGSSVERGGALAVVPDTGEESDARRRARIRVELAAGYYQQGNFQVALDELGQALRADPDYPAAYSVLGLVYMDLGERERAEESFQRGLKRAPQDAELNNNYGWFLCQTGRERDAIARFEQALRDPLYRTPSMPLRNAGICSLRMGDEAAAEAYLQRAFQINAADGVAMFHLAQLYLKKGDLPRAQFHSQRLLSTIGQSAQTLWLALKVERALGNRDAEASLGSQLRRRFPNSPEAGLLAAGRYSD
jgi:type IV pilus assembly protein PilF